MITPEFDILSNKFMDYLDRRIKYGWIDVNGNKKVNTLEGIRTNYRINSIKESINSGLGTCIEQANIIKKFFDRNGYETKLFCQRGIIDDQNDKIEMHCFVLIKFKDKWYHFEHSNPNLKGIHMYNSIESALEFMDNYKSEDQTKRTITEIDEIPVGYTFDEFNSYIDEFVNNKKRKIN